jgi:nitroreductase
MLNGFHFRHACREFDADRIIPREDMEFILETASHIVIGLTMKSPFMKWDSDYLPRFMKNVQELPDDAIKARVSLIESFQKNDFDLNDDRKLFDWASKEIYIALGNMMTAAALTGIDSCPIEDFRKTTTEAILKDKLGVDTDRYTVSFMLAFGYRIKEPRAKTRRSMGEVVTWK